MSVISMDRSSSSSLVDMVSAGRTVALGQSIRPAEMAWHLVFVRRQEQTLPLLVGPLSASGIVAWQETGVEILWIKFRLGVWMPGWSTRDFLDREIRLPDAGSRSFWLGSSAWQVPTYTNADSFVERLARLGLLVRDPLVAEALLGRPLDPSPRTLRHRFLHVIGCSQARLRQVQRAQQAAALLQTGVEILDVVDRLGYYDQPHLTHALRRWVGYSPAQLQKALAPT